MPTTAVPEAILPRSSACASIAKPCVSVQGQARHPRAGTLVFEARLGGANCAGVLAFSYGIAGHALSIRGNGWRALALPGRSALARAGKHVLEPDEPRALRRPLSLA